MKDVPRLQAKEAECAADETTVKEKAGLLATAVKAVEDYENVDTVDGWGAANKARQEAVTAAGDKEAAENIASLLDLYDTALNTERVKADAFVTADNKYQKGKDTAAAAATAASNAEGTLTNLSDAKKTAADAVTAVTNQIAKEKDWRGWLYCELGAAVESVTYTAELPWYKLIDSSNQAAPAKCVVPEVKNDADV